MPQSTTKSWFAVFLILVLLSAATLAAVQEAARPNEPNEALEAPNAAGAMLVDAFLLRPLGLAATGLGTATFIVTLPFSLPTRSADDAAKVSWSSSRRPTPSRGLWARLNLEAKLNTKGQSS